MGIPMISVDVLDQEGTEFVQSQRSSCLGALGARLEKVRVCISRQESDAAH
jgi:hypothetical protein